MKPFLLMLTFLTRLPGPKKLNFDDGSFAKGVYYMPLIGLIIGSIMVASGWILNSLKIQYQGFWLMLVYLMVTGGLHLDGVADYSDGTFSYRSPERMLMIMKDSHIGTFGVVALVLVIIGDMLYLSQVSLVALILFPVVGRTMGLLAAGLSKYPKEEGLAKSLVDHARPLGAVILTVMIGAIILLAAPKLIFGLLLSLGVTLLILFRTRWLIGGSNGDTIGFIIEIGQLVFLIGGSVLWF